MIVHVLHVWSYTLQFTKMLAQGKQKGRDMGPSLSSLQRPMGFNYLKMKDILSIWKICGNGVVCLAGTCSACLCCIWSFTLLSASHVSFRTILQIYLWLIVYECTQVCQCVCACEYLHVWRCPRRLEVSDLLDLELQTVVSHVITRTRNWRAAGALTCRVASSVCYMKCFLRYFSKK